MAGVKGRSGGWNRKSISEVRLSNTFRADRHAARAKATFAANGNAAVMPEPPSDLTERQRAVWLELAPHAAAQRTLVPETVAHFRMLCSAVALQRAMLAELEADGLTGTKVTLQMDAKGGGLRSVAKRAHTLLSKLTTMMQRVDAGMVRFGLSPVGKPMVEETPLDPAEDPFAQFERPTEQPQ